MAEKCQYTLSLQGSIAGSYVMRTNESKKGIFLQSHLKLQGTLGQQTVTQQSRLHPNDLYSLSFNEEASDRHQHSTWDVHFDVSNGLVTASRNKNDTVSMPYTLPFQDPLGLLYQIRKMSTLPVKVPMLGKSVLVNFVKTSKLSTVLGEHEARIYILHPGGSYVYVDTKAPYHILKLTQKLQHQFVEGSLVKVTKEKDYFKENTEQQASSTKSKSEGRKHKPRKKDSKHRKRSQHSSKK